MHICCKNAETVCGVMDMTEEIPKEFLTLSLDGKRMHWPFDPVDLMLCSAGEEEQVLFVPDRLHVERIL